MRAASLGSDSPAPPERTASRRGQPCAKPFASDSPSVTWRPILAPGGDDDGGPPALVDDLELSWTDLGRLLASYEGWHLRLEIRFRDPSELLE